MGALCDARCERYSGPYRNTSCGPTTLRREHAMNTNTMHERVLHSPTVAEPTRSAQDGSSRSSTTTSRRCASSTYAAEPHCAQREGLAPFQATSRPLPSRSPDLRGTRRPSARSHRSPDLPRFRRTAANAHGLRASALNVAVPRRDVARAARSRARPSMHARARLRLAPLLTRTSDDFLSHTGPTPTEMLRARTQVFLCERVAPEP